MNQQVTDLAALVFWTNVYNKSFKIARNLALQRQFDKLWIIEIMPLFLERLNLSIAPSDYDKTSKWLYEAVNKLIHNAVIAEENITGGIFVEDFVECRTPDFDDFALVEELNNIYYGFKPERLEKFTRHGSLILRTPLPAVVFTEEEHSQKTFVVNNTFESLGFEVNLILECDESIELPPNPYGLKYCLTGIFKIQNYRESDLIWHKIIPNSICYDNLIFGNFNELDNDESERSLLNPKFVTQHNIKQAIFNIEKFSFDYDGEIYKQSINFLNLLEKRDLLAVRCLYEYPDRFFNELYSKITRIDTLKFVYEEQQPAYHSIMNCPNLLSNFENYQIPEQVKARKQEIEYRNWFKIHAQSRGNLLTTKAFDEVHFQKWNCLPLGVNYKNSGPFEFLNLSAVDIESRIDKLLLDCKTYVESLEKNSVIIASFGKRSYAFSNLNQLDLTKMSYTTDIINEVLKIFEMEFKRPLISLLKEYYRIRFNPELVFEEDILTGLGFRQCKVCG